MSRSRIDPPVGPPGLPADPDRPDGEPTPPPAADRRVYIGRVTRAHGLKGDVKVEPDTWRPERFEWLRAVWLEGADGRVHRLTIARVRIDRGAVFLRFEEVARREFAEPLAGGRIFIDESERDELPGDHYYLDDLVGCRVSCTKHGELGVLAEVIETPANDVWQVNGDRGEVLVPALKHVVHEIDVARKRITITLPEGLLPDDGGGE